MQPRLANTPESESFEKPHLTHRVLISLYAGLPLCYLSLCRNTRRACVCLRAASRGCECIGAFGITWSRSPFLCWEGKKKKNPCTVTAKGGGKKAVSSCVWQTAPLICVCVKSGASSLKTGSAFTCVGLKPEEETLHVIVTGGKGKKKQKITIT